MQSELTYQDGQISLHCVDAKCFGVPEHNLLFTDPIYSQTEDYEWLSQQTECLLVWVGFKWIYPSILAVGKHLPVHGVFAYTNQTTGHLIGKVINKAHFVIWAGKEYHGKMLNYLPNGYVSIPWWKEENYHKWTKNPKFVSLAIDAFTKEGDVVFDPFFGHGVVAVCCKAMNRRFVGCEIDRDSYQETIRRLQDESVIELVRQYYLKRKELK